MDFSILKTLTELPGTAGRETLVRDFLKSRLAPHADSLTVDALGNLIAFKKGASEKNLLLAAHMDEVGLMVNYIDDKGFLRFVTVGGIDPRTLLAQRVRVQTKNGPVLGVIGTKPAHITTEADRGKAVPAGELFIDIGFNGEEAKKRVEIGDFAVLDRAYEEFGDGLITAKALDNRAGAFVLLEAFETVKNPAYNLYAVFTVQEEVGLRGATTAAFGVDADLALAIDTTGAADIPACRPQDYITSLNGGVGVTALDARTITNPKLFDYLKDVCRQNGIAFQVRIAPRGGNDAGAIHQSKTGVPTCGLSVPTRYIHSNVEVVSKQDLDAAARLTRAVMQSDPAADFAL